MFKKTLTYTDYNGVERTEDLYFHLSEAEILELELSINGGFSALMQKIVNSKDVPSLVANFKDLVLRSYGEKSDDGRRFKKTKEIKEAFAQTEAYSIIFMELAMDDVAASDFIKKIIPVNMAKELAKQQMTIPSA